MWILDNGIWLDTGAWDDTDFWQDYPDTGGAVSGTLDATEAPDQAAITGTVESEELPGVGGGGPARLPWRPHPELVEGFGYGILPPLRGEAFGVVAAAGAGAATVPALEVFGIGAAGASGASRAQLAIKAIGAGDRGTVGRAAGGIAAIKGAGIARHDDDAAVVMFLIDA